MCQDALPGDFTKSRFKWYDFPASLLYHRAVRCRMCNQRYYMIRSQKKLSFLPDLWMHYAILLSVVFICIGYYQRNQNIANKSKIQSTTEQSTTHSAAYR